SRAFKSDDADHDFRRRVGAPVGQTERRAPPASPSPSRQAARPSPLSSAKAIARRFRRSKKATTMITRTMARAERRPSRSSPPPLSAPPNDDGTNGRVDGDGSDVAASSPTSPYSLSNEDMHQLTEEFDGQEEMTTSGRTYEELVRAGEAERTERPGRDSAASELTEESGEGPSGGTRGRKSLGFVLGRNSLSNWSTVGGGGAGGEATEDEDEDDGGVPSSVRLDHLNTGRKSNVSRKSSGRESLSWETPLLAANASHVNVSQRRSAHVNTSRGQRSNGHAAASRPSQRVGRLGRRSNPLNESHVSSSSSSGDDLLGESWSPIRASLEESFSKSFDDRGGGSSAGEANLSLSKSDATSPSPGKDGSRIGRKTSGSLSPIRDRASRSLSPKKPSATKLSPVKERSRSPARRALSPKRSPAKGRSPARPSARSPTRSPVRSPLGDISPNRSPNRGRSKSPKRVQGTSPRKGAASAAASPKKKALSPNGTYSLVEAEGARSSASGASEIVQASGSDGSSSMSLSSGGDSANLSRAKAASTNSADAVGKSRSEPKEPSPERRVGAAENQTQCEDEATTFSPERNSSRRHVRSPVPTPNSRRRVIKRFRASVPTADYLMPEDLLEESVERNPNRKEDVVMAEPAGDAHQDRGEGVAEEVVGGSSQQEAKSADAEETIASAKSTYENAFEFPSKIPAPGVKALGLFHDRAVANGEVSHQYQLNCAGTNLLSLQEVILPAIANEMNNVLRQRQAKAQRNVKDGLPDAQGKEVVEAIKTCRGVVKKCTNKAMEVVGEAHRERTKERERTTLERLEREKEQEKLDRLKAKKERKEARARSRRERYERQKREKQRNHTRNKELWQEVTKLMVDIQKLEKEERQWKEALAEVKRLEEHHQPPERIELEAVEEDNDDQLAKSVERADLESAATTLVADVAMATERLNGMLKSVSLAMEESDQLRKEAYDKYQNDGHKFFGYPNMDDSKGLFMALSMESPLRE
ncbi:hypothetical protein ACHAWF_016608, partial [Thalassiosira exigua]